MAKNDKKIQKFCEELEREINKLNGTKQNRDAFIAFLYRNREIFQNEALFNLLEKQKINFEDSKKIELAFVAQTLTRIELLKDLYLSHTQKTYINKDQFNFLKQLNHSFSHTKTSKFLNNFISDDEQKELDDNHFAKFIEQEVEANYPKDYAQGTKAYPITYMNLYEKMQDPDELQTPNLLPDEIYHFIFLTWQLRYEEILDQIRKCKTENEITELKKQKIILDNEYNIIKQFKCYNQTQLEQKPSPIREDYRKTVRLGQLGSTISTKQDQLKKDKDRKNRTFLILNTLGILIIGTITIALAATGVFAPLSFITAKLGLMFFASHPIVDAFAQGIIAMLVTALPGLALTLKNYFDRPRDNRQQKAKPSADNPDEESLLDSEKDAPAKRGSLVVKIARDNDSGFNMFDKFHRRSKSSSVDSDEDLNPLSDDGTKEPETNPRQSPTPEQK